MTLASVESVRIGMAKGWSAIDAREWAKMKSNPGSGIDDLIAGFFELPRCHATKFSDDDRQEALCLTMSALYTLSQGFRVDDDVEVLRVLDCLMDHLRLEVRWMVFEVLRAMGRDTGVWTRFLENPNLDSTSNALAVIESAWGELLARTPLDTQTSVSSGTPQQNMPPLPRRVARAGASYESSIRQDLDGVGQCADEAARMRLLYSKLQTDGCDAYDDETPLPDFDTWSRYVREYLRLTTGSRRSPRSAREIGGSIVRANEI